MLFKIECEQCGRQEKTFPPGMPGKWTNEAVLVDGIEPLTLCPVCTADWNMRAKSAADDFIANKEAAVTALAVELAAAKLT